MTDSSDFADFAKLRETDLLTNLPKLRERPIS